MTKMKKRVEGRGKKATSSRKAERGMEEAYALGSGNGGQRSAGNPTTTTSADAEFEDMVDFFLPDAKQGTPGTVGAGLLTLPFDAEAAEQEAKRRMEKETMRKAAMAAWNQPVNAGSTTTMTMTMVGKPAGASEPEPTAQGHPEGCACGLHLFPSLFEMAELRKRMREQEEVTKNLPASQAQDEIDRYLKSIP